MNVLSSTRPGFDINSLIGSGMDETYLGLEDSKWNRKFGPEENMNRMSDFHAISNFQSITEISNIIESCSHSIPFYLTLNAPIYTDKERKYILRIAEKAVYAGVDAFIVGEQPLAKMLCELGYEVIISTIAGVYNSVAAQFYYDLGAKRIILPRDLTLDEIEGIVKQVDCEFEVFGYGNGCRLSDSACLGYHSRPHPICHAMKIMPKRIITISDDKPSDAENTSSLFWNDFHEPKSCSICALYRLKKIGISAVKVVGRAGTLQYNMDACKTMKQCIRTAEKCSSEEEYLDKIKNMFDESCKNGLSCYYPEARFG